MKRKLLITDFVFTFNGYGCYIVEYICPKTLKVFKGITRNMPLIDATKNSDEPKQCDLICLRRLCKEWHRLTNKLFEK